jgi:DHA2 family multidrug resistance protein-like MFS transporter
MSKLMAAENSKIKATKKEWFGLAVVALPCMLYSMDLTVLNLAVPKLSASLNPTSSQLLWIVDIYGFLLAGMLITMGTLGDKIGRRKLLMIGAAFFGLASLLASFATTPEILIAARALLGLAGATLAPSTLSLIRNMFLDEKERTTAIAIWITSFSLGGAIGPIAGGILLEYFSWGSVFLIAIPVMLLLLILGPLLLPEYRNPEAGKIDLISSFLSLVMVLTLIYGIKNLSQGGVAWQSLLAVTLSILFGILFTRRQRKLRTPFLDLALFKIPTFGASLTIYMLSTFILFASFFFIGQYLQLVLGLSPLKAGLWTLPSFACFVVGSMAMPHLTGKYQPKYIMSAGFMLAAIGFALLTQLSTDSNPAIIIISISLFSLGIAPVFTLATDMIVGSAPPESAGMASSLSETASELGGALGIAVLGSIGTYVYRLEMDHYAWIDNAFSKSTDTLSRAMTYIAGIPDDKGLGLLLHAKVSFVSSIHWAGALSAIIAIVLAVVCASSFGSTNKNNGAS